MRFVSFRRPLLLIAVLAVSTAGALAPAWAQDPPRGRDRGAQQQEPPRRDGDSGPRMERQRNPDTLADSVRRFERSRGDRVLSAERMQSDGRDVNRIKAMDDRGRVRVYVDDPQRRGQPPSRRERSRDDD